MNDIECGNCKEIFRETEIEQGLCRECWNIITDDVDRMKDHYEQKAIEKLTT